MRGMYSVEGSLMYLRSREERQRPPTTYRDCGRGSSLDATMLIKPCKVYIDVIETFYTHQPLLAVSAPLAWLHRSRALLVYTDMSAINPSLLFSEQQREQARLQTRQNAPVNGRASGSNDINEEGSEGGMAVDDDDSKPNGEAEATVEETQAVEDETEPLNLKDDAVLAAFLAKMDDYEPILPNPVTRYYLERAGFQSNDDRV